MSCVLGIHKFEASLANLFFSSKSLQWVNGISSLIRSKKEKEKAAQQTQNTPSYWFHSETPWSLRKDKTNHSRHSSDQQTTKLHQTLSHLVSNQFLSQRPPQWLYWLLSTQNWLPVVKVLVFEELVWIQFLSCSTIQPNSVLSIFHLLINVSNLSSKNCHR